MTTPNAELASRLRLLAKKSGFSMREFSRRTGQSESHFALLVDRLEGSETADVQRRTLESIATKCGVSLDWLVRGEGEAPTDEQVRAALANTAEVST